MSAFTQTEMIRLSPPERLALISDLWDSLSDAEAPFSPEQADEIERRLNSFEEDRRSAVTWDELRAELASPVYFWAVSTQAVIRLFGRAELASPRFYDVCSKRNT